MVVIMKNASYRLGLLRWLIVIGMVVSAFADVANNTNNSSNNNNAHNAGNDSVALDATTSGLNSSSHSNKDNSDPWRSEKTNGRFLVGSSAQTDFESTLVLARDDSGAEDTVEVKLGMTKTKDTMVVDPDSGTDTKGGEGGDAVTAARTFGFNPPAGDVDERVINEPDRTETAQTPDVEAQKDLQKLLTLGQGSGGNAPNDAEFDLDNGCRCEYPGEFAGIAGDDVNCDFDTPGDGSNNNGKGNYNNGKGNYSSKYIVTMTCLSFRIIHQSITFVI